MQNQINLTNNVNIEFTPQEMQIVMVYLRKGVFEQVAPILNNIEQQIIKQLESKSE